MRNTAIGMPWRGATRTLSSDVNRSGGKERRGPSGSAYRSHMRRSIPPVPPFRLACGDRFWTPLYRIGPAGFNRRETPETALESSQSFQVDSRGFRARETPETANMGGCRRLWCGGLFPRVPGSALWGAEALRAGSRSDDPDTRSTRGVCPPDYGVHAPPCPGRKTKFATRPFSVLSGVAEM